MGKAVFFANIFFPMGWMKIVFRVFVSRDSVEIGWTALDVPASSDLGSGSKKHVCEIVNLSIWLWKCAFNRLLNVRSCLRGCATISLQTWNFFPLFV